MKHDELMLRLADYLGSMTDRMLWTDMQLGPSGSPRPDVYTIRKSYTQPKPMAYEVKVSMSDFRSDVTKGKWQSYLEFAGAVIFVVPKGLITKNDIPNGCGLMTYSAETDSFANLKKPTLHPVSLPEHVMLKLLIDGANRVHEINRRRLLDEYQIEARVRKTLGDEVAAAVFDVRKAEQSRDYKIERIRMQIEQEEKQLEAIRDRKNEARKHQDDYAKQAFGEIYEALGIEPDKDFNSFQVRRRIRELTDALSRDTAIADLENQIDQIRRSIDRPTPMEKLRQAGGAS